MGSPEALHLCLADYGNAAHAAAVLAMLDAYARDPMGGGEGLSEFARTHLIAAMAARPQMFSVLAFDGAGEQSPVGLVNCIEGFSTFACKPLVNIHDLVVHQNYRGRQLGERLIRFVEDIARTRGACKLTLEVLSGNGPAMRLYERTGFAQYVLDPAAGQARFLQKWLA